ncbi:hypothetical protein [Sphaerothrix gracilis]|uniref:hypothetical protein n=1 Tax=Sphaerothrix gracilis TaxID=3151835 RepID=UPI0031FC92E9
MAEQAAEIQSAIAGIPRVEAAIAQGGDVPYGGEIHYILSRMTSTYRGRLPESDRLPPVGEIGLFSQSLDEWVPQSFQAYAVVSGRAIYSSNSQYENSTGVWRDI